MASTNLQTAEIIEPAGSTADRQDLFPAGPRSAQGIDGDSPIAGGAGTATVTSGNAIPAVLERESFEFHLGEFVRQFAPVGHIETMIVRDLARHAAGMERWNEALGAIQRQRSQRLPELAVCSGDDDEIEDSALAAAVSTPDVHLCESHAQNRSRGIYRALRTLLDLQAQRKRRENGDATSIPPSPFATENACEQHLLARFERGQHACRRCSYRRGHYLAARRTWECAECGRQTGIRAGTVAADSPLPLRTWFRAIELLLWNPAMGTTELAMYLGVSRATTVRSIAKRIRTALSDERASELLAGLDRLGIERSREFPASSARFDQHLSGDHASLSQSAPAGASSNEIRSCANSDKT